MPLLSQVPLVVGDHLAHMLEVFIGVFVLLFVRVALQDVDDLGAAVVTDSFATLAVGPTRTSRIGRFEPFLKIGSGHVDEFIELFDDVCVGFGHCGRGGAEEAELSGGKWCVSKEGKRCYAS